MHGRSVHFFVTALYAEPALSAAKQLIQGFDLANLSIQRNHAPMLRLTLLTWCCSAALGYTPPGTQAFAVFGEEQTLAFIPNWHSNTESLRMGVPSALENNQRFISAVILLETDPAVGCFASAGVPDGDGVSLFVTKFTGAQHRLLMPLWQPNAARPALFHKLAVWHHETFSDKMLTGAHLDRPEDRTAWAEAFGL